MSLSLRRCLSVSVSVSVIVFDGVFFYVFQRTPLFFFLFNSVVAGSGARALLSLIAKTRANIVRRMSKEAAS